jgi:heme oxygenase
MSAIQSLRAATAADHDAVDAAFGKADLGNRQDYGRFLTAHALALPAVERALEGCEGPPRRPRASLIESDLRALGLPMPSPLPFAPPETAAAAYGMAYVIEGSRLGGGLLARQIGEGLPVAYLSATHLAGEWRGFLAELDAQADGPGWIERAAAAARATFELYREAAATAL